ncbi:MAG TPA: hypothetical protein VIN60_04485, partial [Anaerolineales bacterium]
KVYFQEAWTHGRWTPSAMDGPKTQLYLAQGKGLNLSYPGQMDTNIYFAGNNTTVDSEEGGLVSAMAIANYAFGVDYPLINLSLESLFAFSMYSLYADIMFPNMTPHQKFASLYQTLPDAVAKPKAVSLVSARMPAKAATRSAKRSTVKKKAVAKKAKPQATKTKAVKAKKRIR